MAKTVNGAFEEFLTNAVRLSESISDKAKASRDFLKNEIRILSNNNEFLILDQNRDCNFGSFARKTKIRPLDDIDLIVALNGSNCSLDQDYTNVSSITYSGFNTLYKQICDQDLYGRNHINSTKVNNLLKKALNNISQYENAEIHTRGEAVTLKLKSYDWTFDIVPAFFTTDNNNRIKYYYIPDGNGKWKRTNPIKERERIKRLNQSFNGKVYDVVRLVKYWNNRAKIKTITSYVLEAMVLDYFEQTGHNRINNDGTTNDWVDLHFRDFLNYMANTIYYPINDPKGIDGNINELKWFEQKNIAERAKTDYEKAKLAAYKEIKEDDQPGSINIWRDIFGDKFPKYE